MRRIVPSKIMRLRSAPSTPMIFPFPASKKGMTSSTKLIERRNMLPIMKRPATIIRGSSSGIFGSMPTRYVATPMAIMRIAPANSVRRSDARPNQDILVSVGLSVSEMGDIGGNGEFLFSQALV